MATAALVGGLVANASSSRTGYSGLGSSLFISYFGRAAMIPLGIATAADLSVYGQQTTNRIEIVPAGTRQDPCAQSDHRESRIVVGLRDGSEREAVTDSGGTARFTFAEAIWEQFSGTLDLDISVDSVPTSRAILKRNPGSVALEPR